MDSFLFVDSNLSIYDSTNFYAFLKNFTITNYNKNPV